MGDEWSREKETITVRGGERVRTGEFGKFNMKKQGVATKLLDVVVKVSYAVFGVSICIHLDEVVHFTGDMVTKPREDIEFMDRESMSELGYVVCGDVGGGRCRVGVR